MICEYVWKGYVGGVLRHCPLREWGDGVVSGWFDLVYVSVGLPLDAISVKAASRIAVGVFSIRKRFT